MFGEADDLGSGEPQITDQELNEDVSVPTIADPTKATPDEVAALLKSAKTLSAQKGHWRKKAVEPTSGKTYAELYTDAQKKITPEPKPSTGDIAEVKTTVDRLAKSEEKRTFGYQHQLDPEETDKLFAYAAGAGMKPADALKDEFFKNALTAHRTAKRNSNATLGPSNRRPTVEGKDFDTLPKADKRKNFGAFLQSTAGRGRQRS